MLKKITPMASIVFYSFFFFSFCRLLFLGLSFDFCIFDFLFKMISPCNRYLPITCSFLSPSYWKNNSRITWISSLSYFSFLHCLFICFILFGVSTFKSFRRLEIVKKISISLLIILFISLIHLLMNQIIELISFSKFFSVSKHDGFLRKRAKEPKMIKQAKFTFERRKLKVPGLFKLGERCLHLS